MSEHHYHTPDDPRIFVFGSNLRGIHGAGAAHYAHMQLGAEWGVGEGPTGRCYALPTCYSPGVPLGLGTLFHHIQKFVVWARFNPETRFFISEVGCGLAGFKAGEIAHYFGFFEEPPVNCDFPPSFKSVIAAAGKDSSNV